MVRAELSPAFLRVAALKSNTNYKDNNKLINVPLVFVLKINGATFSVYKYAGVDAVMKCARLRGIVF